MLKKYRILFFLLPFFFLNLSFSYDYDDKKKIIVAYVDKIDDINRIESLQTSIKNYHIKNSLTEFFGEKLQEKEKYLNEMNNTQKILLGYSSLGYEIYAYYKGDLNKPFFGVFADIHGGYEYGTYNTANLLVEKLEKSNKSQRFVIPTLNPDGLQIAKNDNFQKRFYTSGRENGNGVDINRNFCTSDFKITTYSKNYLDFYSGDYCNSEKESLLVDNILKKYKFSEIISLHSEGKVIFIPDDSYYDFRVIALGNKLKHVLSDYYFEIPSYKEREDNYKKSILEINNNNDKGEFSGLMENYIYEKYDIPTVLVEFERHGEVEYDLLNIVDYLK